jgi:hypothetical protein
MVQDAAAALGMVDPLKMDFRACASLIVRTA